MAKGGPKPKSREQFIREALERHEGRYLYDRVVYVNSYTRIEITCPNHGYFSQRPTSHLRGAKCPKCPKKRSTEGFIRDARAVHGDKYNYSRTQYTNNRTKVTIICSNHGEFQQQPVAHLRGQGCPPCSYHHNGLRCRYTTEQFRELCLQKHGDTYGYSEVVYEDIVTPVTIVCPEHGEFQQKPRDHLNGHGCQQCSREVSKVEVEWLDSLGVETRQHKVKGTRYRVDGYNPNTNTVYEFFGDFWHGNPTVYALDETNRVCKKTFGELFCKTMRKVRSLEALGYKVVYVWEADWKGGVREITPERMTAMEQLAKRQGYS